MKLLVNDTKLIRTLQREFGRKFPHLKLEFYSKRYGQNEIPAMDDRIDENLLLGEFRFRHNSESIEINGNTTVKELKDKFWNIFGLAAGISRQTGNEWIHTRTTEDWSLDSHEEFAKNNANASF